jgi:hypothetical protein
MVDGKDLVSSDFSATSSANTIGISSASIVSEKDIVDEDST